MPKRKMVFIGNTSEIEKKILCPYCGSEISISTNICGEPKVVEKCNHFTSIFVEAKQEQKSIYCHYARFCDGIAGNE